MQWLLFRHHCDSVSAGGACHVAFGASRLRFVGTSCVGAVVQRLSNCAKALQQPPAPPSRTHPKTAQFTDPVDVMSSPRGAHVSTVVAALFSVLSRGSWISCHGNEPLFLADVCISAATAITPQSWHDVSLTRGLWYRSAFWLLVVVTRTVTTWWCHVCQTASTVL
jgi:hypothetical protein